MRNTIHNRKEHSQFVLYSGIFRIVRPQMWPSAVRLNLDLFLCSDIPCDDDHRFESVICFCAKFQCRALWMCAHLHLTQYPYHRFN